MNEHNEMQTEALWVLVKGLFAVVLFICIFLLIYFPLRDTLWSPSINKYSKEELQKMTEKRSAVLDSDYDRVENGIHVRTGMAYDKNFDLVKAACTSCHSSKLIIQNRADRVGWKQMIVWMQETQGLPDLGTVEPKILDYLSKHYAPKKTGRRANLESVEWYVLEKE